MGFQEIWTSIDYWISDNQTIVSVGNALFSIAVGAIGALYVLRHKTRTDRERSDEQVSMKLLESRLKPYAQLMNNLAKVSKLKLEELDIVGRRARALETSNDFHHAIYGEVGILASTLTRETILCARRRCIAFSKDLCTQEDMLSAIWAVHQMLRSDLNHTQDQVAREFDRVRSKLKNNITEEVIEHLIATMPHVQFKDHSTIKTQSWLQNRKIRSQTNRILGR